VNGLKGQVALVTGSSRGIGRAIALKFAEHGANVVVNYVEDKQGADETKAAAEAAGVKALLIQGDVSRSEDVERLVGETYNHFRRLDVLVNNAGLAIPVPLGDLKSLTEENWDKTMNVTLKGTFLCCRAAAPLMADQPQGGKIINIASIGGLGALGSSAAYSAAKAGVISLTRTLAVGLAPRILVNAIAPGAIDTDFFKGRSEEQMQRIRTQNILRRLGRVSEIADMALFLVEHGSFITGQVFVVDGGTIFH
jgi:3-oxoacyl-[acyl-carrier protein] reductase